MTARDVTATLAPPLQLLELEQPRVVSRRDIEAWAREVGISWSTDVVVQRLRERGWLLDLKTRGVWEFAPAARAGVFGAGDPLIELRATLRRDRGAQFSVAAESAAYLLGYAGRRPALYRDWPNVGEWLASAAGEITIEELSAELTGRPRSARARAGYLLDRAGRPGEAAELVSSARPGRGPYCLGSRDRPGRYNAVYHVIDSTGVEVQPR